MSSGIIMTLKGSNRILNIYSDRVEFVPESKSLLNTILTGTGQKGGARRTLFYKDLMGVEYKPPSKFVEGYMRFLYHGSQDTKVSSTAGMSSAFNDNNAVTFGGGLGLVNKISVEDTNKAYDFIMAKIAEYK